MWPVAYRMITVSVILNDLEGHSPVAGLFKYNPSNICAAFYQIQLTACSRGSSATAWLLAVSHQQVRGALSDPAIRPSVCLSVSLFHAPSSKRCNIGL